MRLYNKSWVISFAAVSLVGFANAQPEQQPTPETQPPIAEPVPGAEPARADPNIAPPAELTAQQDVKLTPQQMLKQAGDHISRMDQASRSVRTQLTQARQERDVVKVLCLNDKLNQINVALASANDRQRTLDAMVKENDADGAKHESTIIGVLRNRVETLVTEANQCIGEELGYLGETAVNVSIDPDIPDTDPAGFPRDPFIGGGPTIISEPRVPASPG